MKLPRIELSIMAVAIVGAMTFTACDPDGGINIFSIQDDIALGQQVRDEILSKPAEYPILPEAQYPQAYQHLRRIRDNILNSGMVAHKDDFEWTVYIIQDDDVLNAFCVPGGYIFVYTGIIKYLDTEDEFAGVMGHEIAHADRRHSTDQMTQAYGIQTLLEVVLGNNQNAVTQIASGLLSLSFSRKHETEADKYSVIYLCESPYASNGAAGFFEKLIAGGQGGQTPQFLSTHPNPDNRVAAINGEANTRGCSLTENPNGQWSAFQNSLP